MPIIKTRQVQNWIGPKNKEEVTNIKKMKERTWLD